MFERQNIISVTQVLFTVVMHKANFMGMVCWPIRAFA